MERAAHAILADSGRTVGRLAAHSARAVAAAAESAVASLGQGGSIYFCGNGGSAADAQHLACELAGRYLLDRPPLPAVALSTNSSSLTAIGNDFGYDQVFARQLEGLGSPGDVLVAITTSGRSKSVLRAVEVARALGMVVIGMTGAKGGAFAARCDLALVTPHHSTPRIQEGHIAMGHALCELIERELFARPGTGPTRRVVRRRRPLAARGPAR
jgi:D-sedoheptulose 7-phosphate isomerase